MPSIDIVSRRDLQEVEDAINGLRQEIYRRFDFKDPGCAPERKDAPIGLPGGVGKKDPFSTGKAPPLPPLNRGQNRPKREVL
ncbi:MAG: DUF520 family protein, partial [Nitrospinae bacterium]|nr:DUF520 family protein [Nitrospinota bacterium]